jgi:hypothetical protein
MQKRDCFAALAMTKGLLRYARNDKGIIRYARNDKEIASLRSQ